MEINWKTVVSGIAPALTTILAGPLAGGAVKILADAVLGGSSGDPAKDEADLQKTMTGPMTPELEAQIQTAEATLKTALIAADVRKTEIAADTEKSYLADVADARAHNANTVGILRLGYIINCCSYLLVAATLVGSFALLLGVKLNVDPGIAAMVGGTIGACLQWVIGNSTLANSFFFGSSPTARANSTAMAASVSQTAAHAGKPK